jgi:hypothetical protein
MADDNPIYDNPKSPKKSLMDKDSPAKKGQVEGEWESMGSLGTRKGGSTRGDKDEEGDLDKEAYDKDRDSTNSLGTDHNDPNDAKGWRRQFWRKRAVPTS